MSSTVGGRPVCRWFRKTVADFFGKEPRKDVNGQAVAVGAAVQGGVLGGDVKDDAAAGRYPAVSGYRNHGRRDDSAMRRTPLSRSTQPVFSTAEDNQSAVTIHVLQVSVNVPVTINHWVSLTGWYSGCSARYAANQNRLLTSMPTVSRACVRERQNSGRDKNITIRHLPVWNGGRSEKWYVMRKADAEARP